MQLGFMDSSSTGQCGCLPAFLFAVRPEAAHTAVGKAVTRIKILGRTIGVGDRKTAAHTGKEMHGVIRQIAADIDEVCAACKGACNIFNAGQVPAVHLFGRNLRVADE